MTHAALPPDELDKLLSAYFKSQVPDPWPAFRGGPLAEPAGQQQPGYDPGAIRSRVVLAASAAALLGLGLYLSSGATVPVSAPDHANKGGLLKDATASGKGLVPEPNR